MVDMPIPTFDAAMLKAAVRWRHAKSSCVVVDELRTHAGMGGGHRFVDMWVLSADTRSGCAAEAYEIKVSRSDFVRDMRDQNKQRGARFISDRFWFVAPPGVIQPDEVPLWAGLLEPRGAGGDVRRMGNWSRWMLPLAEGGLPFLQEIVPAPHTSKAAPSWPLVVSLLRKEPIVIEGGERAG